MSFIGDVPVEHYLKALALIRNRLGDPDEGKDRDFDIIVDDVYTRDELMSVLVVVCAIAAVTLEGLGDLFESLTGEMIISPDEAIPVAEDYLDVMMSIILGNAVARD